MQSSFPFLLNRRKDTCVGRVSFKIAFNVVALIGGSSVLVDPRVLDEPGPAQTSEAKAQMQTKTEKRLEKCRMKADRRCEALALLELGVGYRDSFQQPEKALASFDEALLVFREIKDKKGQAVSLVGIGLADEALGAHRK